MQGELLVNLIYPQPVEKKDNFRTLSDSKLYFQTQQLTVWYRNTSFTNKGTESFQQVHNFLSTCERNLLARLCLFVQWMIKANQALFHNWAPRQDGIREHSSFHQPQFPFQYLSKASKSANKKISAARLSIISLKVLNISNEKSYTIFRKRWFTWQLNEIMDVRQKYVNVLNLHLFYHAF